MIIFNFKAVIVGIGAFIIFMIFGMLDLPEWGLLLGGITGFFLSMLVSEKGEGCATLPSVFFIPTHVYSILIIMLGIFMIVYDDPEQEKIEENYGKEFDRDVIYLSKDKYNGDEDLAYSIDSFLQVNNTFMVNIDDYSYFVDQKDEKILVLIARNESAVKDEYQLETTQLVLQFLNQSSNIIYIGIVEYNYIIETFDGIEIAKGMAASESDLYGFYK